MKERIKKMLPEVMLDYYRKFSTESLLSDFYKFDQKRFSDSAYNFREQYTFNNLRAKITFHYHSIEKGLSNLNFRPGFGKAAFSELFYSMDMYLELGFPTNDTRFQQGISTIEEYVNLHNEINYEVEEISNKLQDYSKYGLDKYKFSGGATEISLKELPDYTQANFKELAQNRYSIRDFGESTLEDKDIFEALQISTKTPSVCNRQAYKTYYIKDSELLNKVYQMQGGLTTNGVNLQGLLLVTGDRQYMNGPHERNQTYIDGGMYTMSLVYALTYKNIATCTLNTNFNLNKEKSMRELLAISYSEDLIAFIALGSFPENIKYANSPRDDWEKFTRII